LNFELGVGITYEGIEMRGADMIVKRGDVFYADLRPVVGSEQGGIRPVVIIQNDIGNRYSPTVICAAITSKINKAKMPTHVEIEAGQDELVKDSVILLEQIRTIDKKRLKEKICHLNDQVMERVDQCVLISLGLALQERQ
jgi:hypothetical protein